MKNEDMRIVKDVMIFNSYNVIFMISLCIILGFQQVCFGKEVIVQKVDFYMIKYFEFFYGREK